LNAVNARERARSRDRGRDTAQQGHGYKERAREGEEGDVFLLLPWRGLVFERRAGWSTGWGVSR
jgi:hypothetical protein